MPSAIGIDFKDNDFCKVAISFMEGLKQYGIHQYTKEKVVLVWNASCNGLYRLHQNPFEYNIEDDITSYLQITEKDVYFNEEVDKYICSAFLNSEFAVIDSRYYKEGSVYII